MEETKTGNTEGEAAADEPFDQGDLIQFEICEKRTVDERIDYGFIRTHRPVLDDGEGKSFKTMKEYREWCNKNLPMWLGYDSGRR